MPTPPTPLGFSSLPDSPETSRDKLLFHSPGVHFECSRSVETNQERSSISLRSTATLEGLSPESGDEHVRDLTARVRAIEKKIGVAANAAKNDDGPDGLLPPQSFEVSDE